MGPEETEQQCTLVVSDTIPAPPPSDPLTSVRAMPKWMPPEGLSSIDLACDSLDDDEVD